MAQIVLKYHIHLEKTNIENIVIFILFFAFYF